MYTSFKRFAVVVGATTAMIVGSTTPASAETAPDVIGLPGKQALALFKAEGFTNVYLSIRGSNNPVLSTSLHRGFDAPADTHILILLKNIPPWQEDED